MFDVFSHFFLIQGCNIPPQVYPLGKLTEFDETLERLEAGELSLAQARAELERTRNALAQSDVALVIFDGSHALDTNDAMLIKEIVDKKCLR